MPAASRSALIVTVGRGRGSLAAVRALGLAGWTVGVGTPDGDGMVTDSRWCHRRHVVPRPRGDAEGFLKGVRDAVFAGDYDVVFGGSDDWMAALSTYRDEVPAQVAHPAATTVAAALDKFDLVRRAHDAGIAAPRTVLAEDQALEAWTGPVVVKCRAHWHPGQQQKHRVEARRYSDVAAAADRLRFVRDAGFEPVLQRPVDGRLGALIGLMHGGRLIGRVQQETTRLWPTPSGVSARARTVPVDENLTARCEQLLNDLGWHGLVELQFLTEPGGEPQLIDLNGRFYGSMALARAAGPNLPDAWGRQVLGDSDLELEDGQPGVRFAWTAGDIRRALVERRGGVVRDVLSCLRWALGATTSVWDRHDTGPTRNLVATRLRSAIRDPEPGASPAL